jgi:hypothetical protein
MVAIGLACRAMLIFRVKQVDPSIGLDEAFPVLGFVFGQEVSLFHLVGGFAITGSFGD